VTRRTCTTAADHQAAAWKCQLTPGAEVLVAVYPDVKSGKGVARGIALGQMPAYRPPGSYEAGAYMHPDGTAVWARYATGLELEPLPQTLTVRLPRKDHEGVVTVEISARCQKCGGPRGPLREQTFVHDGVRHVRDAWTNACGHRDDCRTVLAEAARRVEQVPKPIRSEPRGSEIKAVVGGRYEKAVGLITDALKADLWTRAGSATQLLEEHGEQDAADAVRTFIAENTTGGCASARGAALYLVYLDTPVDTDTTTITGETK